MLPAALLAFLHTGLLRRQPLGRQLGQGADYAFPAGTTWYDRERKSPASHWLLAALAHPGFLPVRLGLHGDAPAADL